MSTSRRSPTPATATANQSNTPELVSRFIASPAAEPLDAVSEAALARTITESRARVWESLAACALALGGPAMALSEAVTLGAEDLDDETLPRAVALAREAVAAVANDAALSETHCLAWLWRDEATTAARSLKKAKDKLVGHNMRLCVAEARRQHNITKGIVSMADLIQEGSLGLMKAAARFDYRRGLRFTTYALHWVSHFIQRAIADKARTIRLPVHISDSRGRIIKAIRALALAGIADPTPDQIARECTRRTLVVQAERASKKAALSGTTAPPMPTEAEVAAAHMAKGAMTAQRVALVREAMAIACVSGFTPIGQHNDGTERPTEILDMFHDESPDAIDVLTEEDMHRVLSGALDTLKPRTADAIRRHLGVLGAEAQTLEEVGEVHGVSRERIRQMEVVGIRAMRQTLIRRGVTCVSEAGCGA
jgi:RNA polymerase sigma factor (sigma-70 family)